MMRRIILAFWLLPVILQAQTDTTSYFELKLYNTQNKLVSGKDVDLYQSAVKIYDLAESSSIPGVYSYATVKVGEYDIWVNTSLWKSGLWIGSNKVTSVADLFRFTAGPDTMRLTGHIRATSFEGDGSKLTGIVGSISETTGDLILGSDSDANGIGDIYLRTQTVPKMFIKNDGKIGIRTVNPIARLHLHSEGSNSFQMTNDLTDSLSGNGFQISQAISDGGIGIRQMHNSYMWWATNSIERMRLTASGLLGIGLTVPVNNLHISHPTDAVAGIKITHSGSGETASDGVDFQLNGSDAYVWNYENGPTLFGNNNVESGRFTAAGKLGIGTANPIQHIHVHNISGSDAGIQITDDNTDSLITDGLRLTLGGLAASIINGENSVLQIGTNNTANLTCTATGNVAIGQASASEKLHVVGYIHSKWFGDWMAGAWFAGTDDTLLSRVPGKALSASGLDTIYFDIRTRMAITIDSAWAEIATQSTAGDSLQLILGQKKTAFDAGYAGAFTTQNSDIVDLGTSSVVRKKLRFTTPVSLDANAHYEFYLVRKNDISNNEAGSAIFVTLTPFVEGAR